MTAPPAEARPLYDLIYQVLREHLVEGRFPRGLLFEQSAVARAFGASRVPAAAALARLKKEGMLKKTEGRGLIAKRDDPAQTVRLELVDAGLELPTEVLNGLEIRTHHGRIYPEVEHAIGACLGFGRFQVVGTALAEHYGVSRTVAHEILTRLERAGLVEQGGNQRWYAGPLTETRLREHFEMRWLLEPVALQQSAESIASVVLERRLQNVIRAKEATFTPKRFEKLETELHVHTVLHNANAPMTAAIHRSQLHVIPTHSTFSTEPHFDELRRTLDEHQAIYEMLLGRKPHVAGKALESHIRAALAPNVERLRRVQKVVPAGLPPFLQRLDS